MAAKLINATGIALTTIGTVFTLWAILHADPKKVGTWGDIEQKHIVFPKEQKHAKIGFVAIVIGGFFQIVGQFV